MVLAGLLAEFPSGALPNQNAIRIFRDIGTGAVLPCSLATAKFPLAREGHDPHEIPMRR
jgi:hypothetical protein